METNSSMVRNGWRIHRNHEVKITRYVIGSLPIWSSVCKSLRGSGGGASSGGPGAEPMVRGQRQNHLKQLFVFLYKRGPKVNDLN